MGRPIGRLEDRRRRRTRGIDGFRRRDYHNALSQLSGSASANISKVYVVLLKRSAHEIEKTRRFSAIDYAVIEPQGQR